MRIVTTVVGFIAAVATMVVLGPAAHAWFNRRDLEAIGGNFSDVSMLGWMGHDIAGMAVAFGGIMAIGFLIAFIVAAIILRFAPSLRLIGYPLAGGVAVAVAMYAMGQMFGGATPIASVRNVDGFAAQVVAGVLSGVVFLLFNPRRS